MTAQPQRRLIQVCQHSSCLRSGADQVLAAFQEHRSETLMVSGCECQGQCSSGPTVRVMPDNTWYCRVTPADVPAIVQDHIHGGQPVERLLHPRLHNRQNAYANLAAQYQAFMQGSAE